MRLKAVKKRPERDKVSTKLPKEFVEESGKSQNPENAEKIIEKITDKMEGMKGSRK
jgi:hypothetical protein